MDSLSRRLFEPVDIASLAFFRVAIGVCLILHIEPHATGDSPFFGAAAPGFHFSYPFLGWIPSVSRQTMQLILLAMYVASFGITLGLAYRASAIVYALGAAYFHFMDAGKFHNHYYLIVLLSFLIALLPAHGAASVDAFLFRRIRRASVPRWSVWLLRFQVGIPFFFSGLSKLNAEWLSGFPAIFHWYSFTSRHEWARGLDPEFMALFIAWAGALADVSLLPLLVWRRTRYLGFALAVVFNVGIAILFSGPLFRVAMFPWFMISGVTIFLDPDWPRRLWQSLRRRTVAGKEQVHATPAVLTAGRKAVIGLLALWVLIQVLVPLRYHLYPGFHLWTQFGRTHAWQMMGAHKVGRTTFVVTDPATGETWEFAGYGTVGNARFLVMQEIPALIYQYALELKRRMARAGHPGCEVRVESFATLNGRSRQRLIDPDVDLTVSPPRWGYYPWVLPLEEPLPELSDIGPAFFLQPVTNAD